MQHFWQLSIVKITIKIKHIQIYSETHHLTQSILFLNINQSTLLNTGYQADIKFPECFALLGYFQEIQKHVGTITF